MIEKEKLKSYLLSKGRTYPENIVDLFLEDLTQEGLDSKMDFINKARDKLVLLENKSEEYDTWENLINTIISQASNQMNDRFIDKNFEFIDAVRKHLINRI